MRKLLIIVAAIGLASALPQVAAASPEQDLKEMRAYFKKQFPNVPFEEYRNGVYALDLHCARRSTR